MDRFGRRWTVFIGAVVNLLGAALQAGARNLAMILVGRILAGWAVGILSMSVPIYQAECAHPKTRGKQIEPPPIISRLGTKIDRSHRWSYTTDDRCRFHCVNLGRLRREPNSRNKLIRVAISARFPVHTMYHDNRRHSILPRVATLSG